MIHYYTNREIAEKLEVNLARWKRWSRSFLAPDPLGGMQSGYTRQYVFKDLFKVFLGGHLLSHLKLSVAESRQVISDLSPWLKKQGFFDQPGANGTGIAQKPPPAGYRIYFACLPAGKAKDAPAVGYLIRRRLSRQVHGTMGNRQIAEVVEETLIHCDLPDGDAFLQLPQVYLLNLSSLFVCLLAKLNIS
jgi:hypothetical protein